MWLLAGVVVVAMATAVLAWIMLAGYRSDAQIAERVAAQAEIEQVRFELLEVSSDVTLSTFGIPDEQADPFADLAATVDQLAELRRSVDVADLAAVDALAAAAIELRQVDQTNPVGAITAIGAVVDSLWNNADTERAVGFPLGAAIDANPWVRDLGKSVAENYGMAASFGNPGVANPGPRVPMADTLPLSGFENAHPGAAAEFRGLFDSEPGRLLDEASFWIGSPEGDPPAEFDELVAASFDIDQKIVGLFATWFGEIAVDERAQAADIAAKQRWPLIALVAGLALLLASVWLIAADILRSRRRLVTAALSDDMTGLLNRRGLVATMQRVHGAGPYSSMAFLHVDLDRLKPINDEFGHAAGDAAIGALATTLAGLCRINSTDVAARLGGDEFLFVLADDSELERTALVVADRINQELRAFDTSHTQHLSASIGIALAEPPGSIDDLIDRADQALLIAKEAGRGRHQLFRDAPPPISI